MGSLPDLPLPAALEPEAFSNEAADPAAPPALADHSRFVQRVRRRYAQELALLPPGLPRRDVITALVQQLKQAKVETMCWPHAVGRSTCPNTAGCQCHQVARDRAVWPVRVISASARARS